MGTLAQSFWFSQNTKDFTAPGEVDIRQLSPSPQPEVSTTICAHPNSAGTTQITLDPYTTRSTTGDIRSSAGYAINRLGADGMGSAAGARRFVNAGSLDIGIQVFLPQAGTATGTLTASLIAGLYRVSSAGARALIQSNTLPVTFQTTGLTIGGATGPIGGVMTIPTIILEADETLHLGLISNVVQVAGLLGATVACNAAYVTGGAAGAQDVTFPAPGIRTLYTQAHDPAIGAGVGIRSSMVRKDLISAAGKGIGTYDYLAEFFRTFNASGKGSASRQQLLVLKFIEAVGTGVGARSLLVRKDLISAIGKGSGARSLMVQKALISAIGEGAGSIEKLALYTRIFNAIGEGIATEDEVVVFVRQFLATGKGSVRPRIALDWDDLPDAGGGTTVIVRRMNVVADD